MPILRKRKIAAQQAPIVEAPSPEPTKKRKSEELIKEQENVEPNERVAKSQAMNLKHVLEEFDMEGELLENFL